MAKTQTKAKQPPAAKAKAAAAASKAPAGTGPGEGDEKTATQPASTQPPANNPPDKSQGPVPVLFVRTQRGVPRFRRAGFVFTREPYGIALDALDAEQIKALKKEPRLIVEEGTVDPADGESA